MSKNGSLDRHTIAVNQTIMAVKEQQYTPTADKLVTIIADFFHIRKSAIRPESTWPELGLTRQHFRVLMLRLQDQFNIAIYPADYRDLRTVWDLLRYIEGHDSWENIPERVPDREHYRPSEKWGIVCVSPNCKFPRHVQLREEQSKK